MAAVAASKMGILSFATCSSRHTNRRSSVHLQWMSPLRRIDTISWQFIPLIYNPQGEWIHSNIQPTLPSHYSVKSCPLAVYTHARTHARTRARTHERTNARTHERTNARTHTHTHTYTHAISMIYWIRKNINSGKLKIINHCCILKSKMGP